MHATALPAHLDARQASQPVQPLVWTPLLLSLLPPPRVRHDLRQQGRGAASGANGGLPRHSCVPPTAL